MYAAVTATLTYWKRSPVDHDFQGKQNRSTYFQVIAYPLATYATGDVIAESEAKTLNFKQSERLSAVRYFEVL